MSLSCHQSCVWTAHVGDIIMGLIQVPLLQQWFLLQTGVRNVHLHYLVQAPVENQQTTLSQSIDQQSHHSAVEHRVSTRFLHHTLFLTTHLISAQVFFTPFASSSTVLRHVFFGLPLLVFLGGSTLGLVWLYHQSVSAVYGPAIPTCVS